MNKVNKLILISSLSVLSVFSSCKSNSDFKDISINKEIGNQIVKDALKVGIKIEEYSIDNSYEDKEQNLTYPVLNLVYQDDNFSIEFNTRKINKKYYMNCSLNCMTGEGEKYINFFYNEWGNFISNFITLENLKNDQYKVITSNLNSGEFKAYEYVNDEEVVVRYSEYASSYSISGSARISDSL